ncbi:hypothetical protein VTI28DRAFT_8497 [Corynascus sepedonium]
MMGRSCRCDEYPDVQPGRRQLPKSPKQQYDGQPVTLWRKSSVQHCLFKRGMGGAAGERAGKGPDDQPHAHAWT